MNAAQKHVADKIIEAIRESNEKDYESVKTLGTKLEKLGGLLRDLADITCRQCPSSNVVKFSVGTQTSPTKAHFVPQDPPTFKPKTHQAPAKKIRAPMLARPCEFCRQHGHQPENCVMPAVTRVEVLRMRGACMKCCMIHDSVKCPETRKVCKNCPNSHHLEWLCPLFTNF